MIRAVLKGKWRGLVSSAVVLMLAVGVPLAAFASDAGVSVADTDANTVVTLVAGGSENISISVGVTGNQVGTATYKVNRNWTLSGGSFTGANPQTCTVPPRGGGIRRPSAPSPVR